VLFNRLFLKITICKLNFNNSFFTSNWQTFTLNIFLVEKSTGEAIFNLLPAHCAPAPLPVWQQ
jgi:hypothetical protein